MTNQEIIKGVKLLANKSKSVQFKTMLRITIKILQMSDRRIEGFISLIQGFTDVEVHKASSEKKGIYKRKNLKRVS